MGMQLWGLPRTRTMPRASLAFFAIVIIAHYADGRKTHGWISEATKVRGVDRLTDKNSTLRGHHYTQWPNVVDDDRVRPPLVWEPKPVADGDDYKPVNNDTCSYQHGNHPDKYARSQRIPDRFHVHNRADSAFGLMEWLCIRSIKVNANPADGIYFHYVNEPTGPWWELAKPMVKMVKTYKLETYMGYKLKSDIVRMEILSKYGGVYVDIDTLVLRSFAPLYHNHAVLGWEGQHGAQVINAIILAEPGSTFLQKFLGAFAHYTGHWLFVVQTGARLYLEDQSEVCLMPPHFAYYPLWTERGHKMLYSERTHKEMEKMTTTALDTDGMRKHVLFEGQYALHMWWRYVRSHCHSVPLYNLTYINNVNTLMNYLLRPVVAGMDPSKWPASPYADKPCEVSDSDY